MNIIGRHESMDANEFERADYTGARRQNNVASANVTHAPVLSRRHRPWETASWRSGPQLGAHDVVSVERRGLNQGPPAPVLLKAASQLVGVRPAACQGQGTRLSNHHLASRRIL